jgi:hypothetical protein
VHLRLRSHEAAPSWRTAMGDGVSHEVRMHLCRLLRSSQDARLTYVSRRGVLAPAFDAQQLQPCQHLLGVAELAFDHDCAVDYRPIFSAKSSGRHATIVSTASQTTSQSLVMNGSG